MSSLYETTQRRTTEQAALLEASRAISSTLDLPTMLQRLAEQMGRAIDATSTYICDWNPRTGLRHRAGRILQPVRFDGRTRF